MIKNFNHEMEYYFGTFETSLPSTVPPDMTYIMIHNILLKHYHLYYSFNGKYHTQTVSTPYIFSTSDKNYIIMDKEHVEITNDQVIEFIYPGKLSSVINYNHQNKGPRGPDGKKGHDGNEGEIGPQGDDGMVMPAVLQRNTVYPLNVGDVVQMILSDTNRVLAYNVLPYAYDGQAVKITLSSYGDGHINKIAMDNNNNIYAVGYYIDKIILRGIPLVLEAKNVKDNEGNVLVTTGKKQGFIAKYTSNGYCEWAAQVNTDGNGEINDICIGNKNTIYVCGNFDGRIIFYDEIRKRIAHMHVSPHVNGFIAKINLDSSWDWVNRISGSGKATCTNIVLNENEIIYAYGKAVFPASFVTSLPNGTINLQPVDGSNTYEAKLSNNKWEWVRRTNVENLHHKTVILEDKDTIYSLQLTNTFKVNVVYAFIDKRNTDITKNIYRTTIASDDFMKINCMTTDTEGNIYICGHFKGSMLFSYRYGDPQTIQTDATSMFVLKLVDGKHVWMLKARSIGGDLTWIETDNHGNLYVMGKGSNKITFIQQDNSDFESSSIYFARGFIAKIENNAWRHIYLVDQIQSSVAPAMKMFIINSYQDVCILGHLDPSTIIIYRLEKKYYPVGIVTSIESNIVNVKPLKGNIIRTNTISLIQGKFYWINNNTIELYEGPAKSKYTNKYFSERVIGIAIDNKTLLTGSIDYLMSS